MSTLGQFMVSRTVPFTPLSKVRFSFWRIISPLIGMPSRDRLIIILSYLGCLNSTQNSKENFCSVLEVWKVEGN